MADTGSSIRITRLILVPAIIALAITILRVYGELHDWPPLFFNRQPGGGLAIVGISWLPIIFGPYFGLKLAGAGAGHSGAGKTIGLAIAGFLVLFCGSYLAFVSRTTPPIVRLLGLLLMVAALALQFLPWPSLAKTLVGYGYGARIPVAIVMFFAIRGGWGTHYDALPPAISARQASGVSTS